LIDQWSQRGLPLMVFLSAPDKDDEDVQAARNIRAELIRPSGDPTENPQVGWVSAVAPLLLARPSVQVLVWNNLTDNQPHEFPNSGLFDAQGNAKPALQFFRDLRKAYG